NGRIKGLVDKWIDDLKFFNNPILYQSMLFCCFFLLFSLQNKSFAQHQEIPSLDDLAGTWQNVAGLRSLPAVNSAQGSAQAVNDVLAIGKLSFPPITMTGTTGSLAIDGVKQKFEQSQWYPYQILRKGIAGNIEVETSVRMLYDQEGLLFHIVVTNRASVKKTFQLEIDLTAFTSRHKRWGWKIPRDVDSSTFSAASLDGGKSFLLEDSRDQFSNCFSFEQAPDELFINTHSGEAGWNIALPPQAKRTINYVLIFGEKENQVHELAAASASHFDNAFKRVKTEWEKRWTAMFTPNNPYFSGHVPVLVTSDKKMRRIYYMSLISLLSVYRTCFPVAPRVYVSNTPESNCTMMYFWDTREWATTLALLDPVIMKECLRSWLAKDIYKGYAEEYQTGTLQGVWYSANDYSVFILLNDYLNVTGDKKFLSETISGRTVLQHMDSIATHWKSLVKPGHILADYGGAENLLECVPTYINEVASFNAASVWMMRRVAEIQSAEGNSARAKELRSDADTLLQAVLTLYVPGQGVWDALHNDGKRVDVRHVFDFATVGLTIPNDLTSEMKNEMIDFVERELLTDHWMRAQSLSDPAASVSDRPDHGPMGAFCAWPSETIGAMCEFKKFGKALDFLRRCELTTHEGPFSQSRELMDKTFHAPVKINERGSGGAPSQTYNASNGGGFAETIIREFFGYKPDFLTDKIISDKQPRGFNGELLNVQQGDHFYNISSTSQGLKLSRVK
ncbi:MAG: hypothetical protein KGJ59_15280, partial [Bacteroidota bacterium]|nr:hypothetical protein [Bacteroidota bacterium]